MSLVQRLVQWRGNKSLCSILSQAKYRVTLAHFMVEQVEIHVTCVFGSWKWTLKARNLTSEVVMQCSNLWPFERFCNCKVSVLYFVQNMQCNNINLALFIFLKTCSETFTATACSGQKIMPSAPRRSVIIILCYWAIKLYLLQQFGGFSRTFPLAVNSLLLYLCCCCTEYQQ